MRITKRILVCFHFYGDAEWEVSHHSLELQYIFFLQPSFSFFHSSSAIYNLVKTLPKSLAHVIVLNI